MNSTPLIVRRQLAWSVAGLLLLGSTAWGQVTGPGSSQGPYLIPQGKGVITKSILTVGDDAGKVDGVVLTGAPEGLAVLETSDQGFTLIVGQNDGKTSVPSGSLIRWVIEPQTLRVKSGNTGTIKIKSEKNAVLGPIGSVRGSGSALTGDKTPPTLLVAEAAPGMGRAWAVWTNERAEAIELSALATTPRASLSPNPDPMPRQTLMLWINPILQGGLYAYVGNKTETGTPMQTMGLEKGSVYGVAIDGIESEDRRKAMGEGVTIRRFILMKLGDGTRLDSEALEKKSDDFGVSRFWNPAAGAWDPMRPDDFYFVTTDQFDELKEGVADGAIGRSRLWRLSFHDHRTPLAGGTIAVLLDGIGKYQCLSAVGVDRHGRMLLGESPGNHTRGAKLWSYSIADKTLVPIAELDPDRFGGTQGQPKPTFTRDVAVTWIIDASEALGEGWWLVSVKAAREGKVPGGQVMAVFVP